jgi:hypothetical protein
MAGVEFPRAAVREVHRQERLQMTLGRPRHRLQSSRNRLAEAVAIARLYVDAGFLDLPSPDVETEHRERHRHSLVDDFVER